MLSPRPKHWVISAGIFPSVQGLTVPSVIVPRSLQGSSINTAIAFIFQSSCSCALNICEAGMHLLSARPWKVPWCNNFEGHTVEYAPLEYTVDCRFFTISSTSYTRRGKSLVALWRHVTYFWLEYIIPGLFMGPGWFEVVSFPVKSLGMRLTLTLG